MEDGALNMGTVAWLPSSGTADVSPTPDGTDWSLHVNAGTGWSKPMNFTRGASALSNYAYAPDAADHTVAGRAMIVQFVSSILPPQTIAAQLVTLMVRMFEGTSSDNQFLAWKLYAVKADGSSALGTLIAVTTTATAECGTSLTGETAQATSTAFTANEAFRLVLELGCGGTPSAGSGTNGHNCTIELGEAWTATFDVPQQGDTTQGTPMLVFSNDIRVTSRPRATVALGI